MKSKMDEDDKKQIIHDLNNKIGGDINELAIAHELENELIVRRNHLQGCLNLANNEGAHRLSAAIRKAEYSTEQIEELKTNSEQLKVKVNDYLSRTEPLTTELQKRFADIMKLQQVLVYLKTFEKIDEISQQMKQSNDDEQVVHLYGQLKEMCKEYHKGHRGVYLKECIHYWHNVLKDKLTKHYEDLLNSLKWPFTTTTENPTIPKELLYKFNCLTRNLFLIEEPEILKSNPTSDDFNQDQEPSLPVKILLRPLKKRFTYHFTGSRQTARIDRPEWFFTQILTWVKDHQSFIKNHVQPIADKLRLGNVKTVEQFNEGLIALASERLHTVLGLYHTQGMKSEILDIDGVFAHAVDETLGFHRELMAITGTDMNSILSVLTKAETFVRWLAIEKKYALAKMDETLSSDQWTEPVAAGASTAVGFMMWVPRGADWFIALLKTIEDRYSVLPQPGHRLQFLELQLELVEEWRVRLTQLLGAALTSLHAETFLLVDGSPHPLTAVINAAHHTHTILLQWAHSLHYLQLHYYRRQFQQFTQQQHHDEEAAATANTEEETAKSDVEDEAKKTKEGSHESETDDTMSLKEVEVRAKSLAIKEVTKRTSLFPDSTPYDALSPIQNPITAQQLVMEAESEDAGVFMEAPALLAHLRDAGLSALAEHILLEFKATLRDYKKQKWHAMLVVEELALSVSAPLCRPLSTLFSRLTAAADRLAPALTSRLRTHLAADVDQYIFEEVVLESWFNTGGTMQFIHDVKRNLVPAFAPPNKHGSATNQLPKLLESCKLLNMDYDDARSLRAILAKQPSAGPESLANHGVTHIQTNEALQILNQRTDLSDNTSPSSVMELF